MLTDNKPIKTKIDNRMLTDNQRLRLSNSPSPRPPRVGEDGDGVGDGDGGRISPEHPSPIFYAPRDNISRKGKFPTPI